MGNQWHMHTVSVHSVVAEDTGRTLFRWTCSCGARSSALQEFESWAHASGEKHAKSMRGRPRWGS